MQVLLLKQLASYFNHERSPPDMAQQTALMTHNICNGQNNLPFAQPLQNPATRAQCCAQVAVQVETLQPTAPVHQMETGSSTSSTNGRPSDVMLVKA